MAGQLQWTIGFVMFALFAIALTGFMLGFAHDNNAPISIASDNQINTFNNTLIANTSDFNTNSQSTYASIVNSTIAGGQTTTSGTPFALTPLSVIGVVTNILTVGWNKITGGDSSFSIFLTTFIGVIVFVTAMLLWKTWAGRTPD